MNKYVKRLFLLTTVLMILLTISAINATEVSDDNVIDDAQLSSQDIIESSVPVTAGDTGDNKEITKKDNDIIVKGAATHIVTNDNVDQIFGGPDYNLSDTVNEGDTLDFQGNIDKTHELKISKPVNVISSTKDAVISLHTNGGASYSPGDPGNAFVVNKGASGSNITELYLDNTLFWVYNAENVYFKNMSMVVKDATVGTGTGQTAIRWSNNITLEDCYIYTENNGGSTSIAFTASTNSSVINTTIYGIGNVGNILTLSNIYNLDDKPPEFEDFFAPQIALYVENMDVINCSLNTPNGGGICEPLMGVPKGSRIENCLINATGGTAKVGNGGTFINNTLINGVGLTSAARATISGNVIENASAITISSANVNFTNNTINGTVTVSGTNAIIDGNHIESSTSPALTLTSAATGATVTNNYILAGGNGGAAAMSIAAAAEASATISGNGPESTAEAIIITDETYSDFFNSDGTIIEGTITGGSLVQFEGTFNNRKFVIGVPITATGENQAIFNKSTFTFTADATIKNVQFTGETSNTALVKYSGNIKFNNVTFDGVKTGSQYLVDPSAASNGVSFINCTVKDFVGAAIIRSTRATTSVFIDGSEFTNNNGQYSLINVNGQTWSVTIKNSKFMDNVGQNGAIIQVISSKLRPVIKINNSVFERNTASGKAGVIYSAGNTGNYTIENSNFTDNGVPVASSGSSVTNLAGVMDINNANTNIYLSNNIMTGSIANNGTDIYFEAIKKVYTNAKLIAEDATANIDELVDLKFKITDDNDNLIGFSASRFNYTVTLNDEEISYYYNVPTYPIYGFNTAANKTINASYPAGTYPITLEIKNGDALFSSIEIDNGELEVIDPSVPSILTDETWDQFFNEDGTLKEAVVNEGDELQFHGTFTNRNMNINIPITITTGEDQAVFDGCTFTISSPTTIKNVQFTGQTSSHTITANDNLTFENVTFDAAKATEAYLIDPAVRANITFNNCTVNNFEGNAIVRSSAKRTGISVTVVDSVFKDNNAAFSVFCEFGNGWTINLTNSNFTNNNGQNGAVVQGMSTGNTLKLYIDNCNFDDNTATGKAGVIYSASNNAVISITNSNFTDNKVSSTSSGSSTTNLAQVITLGTGNTDLTLQNNIMSGSTAENGTDIYFELSSAGTGKIYTNAKLTAENASTDKDQYVDLKFKLTDDMGNLIGFKAGNVFNYSVTVNDEVISYVDGGPYYGNLYGFYGSQNKTINATYPGGLYPITIDVTAGADKFDSLEITNGQLEVIAPKPTPTINYDVINDVEGKVAIEFTLLDEDENEITPATLILSGDITATANTNKVYKNSELTEGEYAVNVKFEETDDYQEATLDFTLTVQKDPQAIIDELNQSLIANETALNQTLDEVAALEQENDNLKEQIENLSGELNDTQAALTEAQEALENATETITQLEQNITTLTQELNDTQTALTEAEAAKAQLEEENANLTATVAELEEALAANQTALQEAQETITQLNDNITALETELNNTQEALTEAQETITELNNNITTLEEELTEAQSALEESEEENANLTAKVAELEEALAANQTALQEAQETITQLEDNITALETELNNTQDALEEAQETITELNNNITSLEEELEQTESELADTQDALADANDEIESLNDQIDALSEDLEQTEAELADTQQALEEANEAIEELEYKVSELELALDLAENALDTVIDALEELNQPKETSISIDSITDAKYGDEINISGLLVNEDAIGLANQPVTITFNDEEIETTTRNGEFTYTTTASIVGENTVTVTYAGNDKYTESTATYTFDVAKADTYINITEIETVKKGETTTIAGILYDGNGNALANKVVRLLVNNGRKTVKTNDMGEFSFDYTTTKVGNITVTATYEGNDLYESTTTETQFTVNKLSTIITIDPIETVTKGTQATITGTLTDENGNAIANAQVKIMVNGSPKTLKTDSEGRFTHTYTFGQIGENTIKVTYAGSANYEETEAQTTVEVVKAQPVITLDQIDEVTQGETATFTGKLTDAEGNAIANAQVKLTINGSQKTLKTDENGAFTHTFKMTKEGTNNITAAFNGNNDFAQAETNSTVEVVKAQ